MFTTTSKIPAFLLTAGLLVAAPACASQSRYYGYGRGNVNFERNAYDNGYREGLSNGERDARERRDFRVDRDRDFRDADDGYRGYGDRGEYRRFFRNGYRAGYTEGYNRAGRYDRNDRDRIYRGTAPYGFPGGARGIYGSPAAQNGYRDGFDVGRNDARDRDSYDPRRAKRYREGDHDYDGRYGSRDDYKRDYRAAFQQGYDEGYRQFRR